jgi:hypothetical protein
VSGRFLNSIPSSPALTSSDDEDETKFIDDFNYTTPYDVQSNNLNVGVGISYNSVLYNDSSVSR